MSRKPNKMDGILFGKGCGISDKPVIIKSLMPEDVPQVNSVALGTVKNTRDSIKKE